MSLVKKLVAIHFNPVNLVGALTVLYALITTSLRYAVIGGFVWTIGFVYQKRFRCYAYKSREGA